MSDEDMAPGAGALPDAAILLIEDSHTDALLIQSMLADADEITEAVLHAPNLETGLQLLRQKDIAVILLDLSLPDSSGLETFQTLQQHAHDIPIVVLTGSRDRNLALYAIQQGAQDYLVKDDANSAALGKAIQYAVERKQAEVRLRESENRYKTLVNSVPDAILLIHDNVIVHANARASALFDLPYQNLIGQTPGGLSPLQQPDGSDSETEFQQRLHKRPEQGARWFEWQFRRADQNPLPTEVIFDTVVLDGKPQILAIIRNLTARKQAEQRIRFQASLLDQVQNAVFATDSNDRIIYWNHFATRLYQWPESLAIGRRFSDLIVPEDGQSLLAEIQQALTSKQTWEGELELKRRDGSMLPTQLTLSAVFDTAGLISGYVGIASDIGARKEVERKLEHNAFHDALTGLPNRLLFNDRLSHAIARGAREGGRYAVMILDLDRFKMVNDSLGHLVGDALLTQFSRRVESCLRPQDTLARLGGDEFTILLDDLQHTTDAIRVAERIHEKMAQPFLLDDTEVYTSASIGITFGTANYKEPSQAMRDADIAMYRAKNQGKGCHVIFETGMHDRAAMQLRHEARLRQAIESGEFELQFQPILDLGTRQCVAAEALIHWNSPRLNRFSPQEFLALAEDSGLTIPLGQTLLDEACRSLHAWQQITPQAGQLTIHIKLTARQFCHRGLIEHVESALQRHQLQGHMLTLEITESVLREHPVLAAAMLGDLRDLSVPVCIGDFGTGYSSLSHLHRYPLNALKVGKSFISNLDADPACKAVIQAILGLGDSLGLRVIAEGVETEQQLTQLIELGCHLAQGSFLHQALDSKAMGEYLSQGAGQEN